MLRKLQQDFAEFLVNNNKENISDFLSDKKHINNLDIHKNTFRGGLTKILENNFSQTMILLGEEYFKQVAQKYSSTHLKTDTNLHIYGKDFSIFLEYIGASEHVPYIKEFCDFEYIINQALYKRDISKNKSSLTNLAPETLAKSSLKLHDNISLFKANYNLHDIWYFTLNQDNHISLKKENNYYLIYKENQEIDIILLSEAKYMLLSKEFTFDAICEKFNPTDFLQKFYKFII